MHHGFDDCKFVIARKGGQWVAHFLEPTYDLGQLYHNRPVEIPRGVRTEFILARFAWAIFPLVKRFVEHGPERSVKVWETCEDGVHEVTKTLRRYRDAGATDIVLSPLVRTGIAALEPVWEVAAAL